jgi:hypothetical protein
MTVAINTTGQTIDGSTLIQRCYFMGDGRVGAAATATADINVSDNWVAGTTAGRNNIQAAS